MTPTIDALKIGDAARITRIRGQGAVAQRLLAMGLLPGTRITLTGIAPLGDPLTLQTVHGRLSLRRALARDVEVEKEADAAPLPDATDSASRGATS